MDSTTSSHHQHKVPKTPLEWLESSGFWLCSNVAWGFIPVVVTLVFTWIVGPEVDIYHDLRVTAAIVAVTLCGSQLADDTVMPNKYQTYWKWIKHCSNYVIVLGTIAMVADVIHGKDPNVSSVKTGDVSLESNATGARSESDPTGEKSESDPTGARSESDPTGEKSESDPTGEKSESDPTGEKPESDPTDEKTKSIFQKLSWSAFFVFFAALAFCLWGHVLKTMAREDEIDYGKSEESQRDELIRNSLNQSEVDGNKI